MADKKNKTAAPDKKKGKKGKKGKKDAQDKSRASVATHPRAAQAVRRAKGFGGLAGFALAALLSHGAGMSASGVLGRGLIAGIAGYVLAWACAVTVWRHLLLAEMRAAIERQRELLGDRRTIPLSADAEPAPEAAAAPPTG